MSFITLIASAFCILAAIWPTTAEARRVALVIGNADYRIGRLLNTVNDADAMAEAFSRQLKFDKVILKKNVGTEAFRAALLELSREVVGAEIGVIYFAVHGVEVAGKNFLIPVDASLATANALSLEAIPLETVLAQLDGARKLKLVILDACRNNPFNPAGAKRSIPRGLARIEPESNTLVAYAAREGTAAADGAGQHSPYTAALLKHIATPGLEINLLFRRVRSDVLAATGGEQQPVEYHSLGDKELYLVPPLASPGAPPPTPSAQVDEGMRVWATIKDTTSIAVLEAFRKQYGAASLVADRLAEARIEELKKQQQVAVTILPPPIVPVPQAGLDAPRPAPVPSWKPRHLSIATGGTGGVYFPLGGGLAQAIGNAMPGVTATAMVTGGSVANVQMLGSGQADIAFTQSDVARDAVSGSGRFAGRKLQLRALAVLYPNSMHVVTTSATRIAGIRDLRGRRISTGSPASATEVYALRVLAAAGIDPDRGVQRERLGVVESVNALRQGRIDAFFWVGGVPTAAISDFAEGAMARIRILDIAHLIPALNAEYGPIHGEVTIPQVAYAYMPADVRSVGIWNILAVSATMDDQLVYGIARTVLEKRQDLALVHKEALNIRPEWQTSGRTGIPWHPGALKYFKERGIRVE